MRALRRTEDLSHDTGDIWTAYADLLVSLLMAFALLLFMALRSYQTSVREAAALVEGNKEAIKGAVGSLPRSGGGISFDSTTGSLSMDTDVLFAYNSSELRPAARAILERVRTVVLPKLLASAKVDTSLQEIAVEGHTDTVGSYAYNLDLSYQRARAVMEALLRPTSMPDGHEPRLQALLVAGGRSEARPIRVEGRIVDSLSRRIEIHFRFRNDAILKHLVSQVLRDTAAVGRDATRSDAGR